MPVFASSGGSGNLDGGGGNLGTGDNTHSFWYGKNEGVRVSVVSTAEQTVVATPIDFTNLSINPSSQISSDSIYHFGKVSKISYSDGAQLVPFKGGYVSYQTVHAIPQIISVGYGTNNIEAIKRYFCSEYIVMRVAEISGIDYSVLIGGKYKLLLEPILYYTYRGHTFASTATEVALYDDVVAGDLRESLASVTHKNLPLSMFLEVSELGYPAWNGTTSSYVSNAEIISSLGLGVIRFEEVISDLSAYDYEYRTNTEVITSVMVSGGESSPDSPTTVTFEILGREYVVTNVYYPEGVSQLAWVKWTTPSEPQDIKIDVSAHGGGSVSKSIINVNIVDLNLNPPPNPVADDRNDDFKYSDVPDRSETNRLEWSVWSPYWQSDWEWHSTGVDSGYWEDLGSWVYILNRYYATLDAEMELLNDPKNPTATSTSLKSGYGVNIHVESKVASNQSTAVSKTPNAVSYFLEFGYDTYWRLLKRTESGRTAEFAFQPNVYSTYKNPTHFTPIWMPDGPYEVNTWLIDYWCPAGMLSANLSDSLTIKGNLWQDWHVAVKDPN